MGVMRVVGRMSTRKSAEDRRGQTRPSVEERVPGVQPKEARWRRRARLRGILGMRDALMHDGVGVRSGSPEALCRYDAFSYAGGAGSSWALEYRRALSAERER